LDGKGEKVMDSSMIRIICAVLAVLFLVLIVWRRRSKADE
jgi:hypothetical protein